MAEATELAWLAGIIDGEGCIDLSRRSRARAVGYHMRVSVSNTDVRLVARCQQITGLGRVAQLGGETRRRMRDRWRPCYAWSVSTRQAEDVLRLVLPYLVIKREQADLALLARRYRGRQGRRNEHIEQLAWLDRQLKTLHARGEMDGTPPLAIPQLSMTDAQEG